MHRIETEDLIGALVGRAGHVVVVSATEERSQARKDIFITKVPHGEALSRNAVGAGDLVVRFVRADERSLLGLEYDDALVCDEFDDEMLSLICSRERLATKPKRGWWHVWAWPLGLGN